MVLISPETLQRLNTPIRNEPLNTLESDMDKVLHNPELEDRTKWTQYQQMLQRRQYFHDQMRKPAEIQIVENGNMADYSQNFKEDILRTLPKAFKTKGELLFKRLCDNEVITWDKNGSVSINGGVLPNSNIVDLVCDVVRCKKSGSPAGWKEFIGALRQINIPQEFIGNPQRRTPPENQRPTFSTLNTNRRLRRRHTLTPTLPRRWSHLSLH